MAAALDPLRYYKVWGEQLLRMEGMTRCLESNQAQRLTDEQIAQVAHYMREFFLKAAEGPFPKEVE